MDFLDLNKELNYVRIYLKSNEKSSTFYMEELPFYTDLTKKIKVMSVYFYFRGKERFDVLSLYENICKMKELSFIEISSFIKKECCNLSEITDFSYNYKEIDIFKIKPPIGYKLFFKGRDFLGCSLWSSFFIISENGKFCVSKDSDSSKKIFNMAHKYKDIIKSKNYLFLIKLFNSGKINYEELCHPVLKI